MPTFGPKELQDDVLDRNLCIGCGACVNLCPYLKPYKGKAVMLFPCTLSQGRCHAYCPKAEVDLTRLAAVLWGEPYVGAELGSHRRLVISRTGEKMVKGGYQSGGTVSSLVTLALAKGIIDTAILTDRQGLTPVPRPVTKPDEVVRCASSKYTAAPTLAAYNQAVREGHDRVGIVATPCQATALAQMRLKSLEKGDPPVPAALVIGLFCTWALDIRKLEHFLYDKMDVTKIRWMDIPPPPAEIMVVQTEEERVEFPLTEIRPMIVDACRVCPDITAEWADVSVGVLEGHSAWNTLIIRSQKGEDLVETARREGYLRVKEMPEENLNHLRLAARNKKKRSLTAAREQGLLNREKEGARSVLRIDEAVLREIMGK